MGTVGWVDTTQLDVIDELQVDILKDRKKRLESLIGAETNEADRQVVSLQISEEQSLLEAPKSGSEPELGSEPNSGSSLLGAPDSGSEPDSGSPNLKSFPSPDFTPSESSNVDPKDFFNKLEITGPLEQDVFESLKEIKDDNFCPSKFKR